MNSLRTITIQNIEVEEDQKAAKIKRLSLKKPCNSKNHLQSNLKWHSMDSSKEEKEDLKAVKIKQRISHIVSKLKMELSPFLLAGEEKAGQKEVKTKLS